VNGRDGLAARVLGLATDRTGRAMPAWTAEPVRGAGRVLELGPGVLAEQLWGTWVGISPSLGPGSGARVRAAGCALPLVTNSMDAICLVLTLPRLTALDATFAEVRRVLRPAGTLVVVVPSATVRSGIELRLARVLRPVRRGAWPNRSGLDNAGWLLAAADFAVLADDRLPFTVPMPDPASALDVVTDLSAAGLWPDLPPAVRAHLARELSRRDRPGQVLPVPMRRLVARR